MGGQASQIGDSQTRAAADSPEAIFEVAMANVTIPTLGSKQMLDAYAKSYRLVVRVDGVSHEVIKLDGNTASVTLACEADTAVLVDPDTLVFTHGEIDVDCMTCLVRRARFPC